MVSTIKTGIITALNAMSSLKVVYAFESGNPSGQYPMATVTIREGSGEFRSTAHNLRKHGFWVRVYQEQSKVGQGISAAETITVSVLDELFAHFDRVTTLSGLCKYVTPVSYNARYVDREHDVRILEVQLDAWEIVASA